MANITHLEKWFKIYCEVLFIGNETKICFELNGNWIISLQYIACDLFSKLRIGIFWDGIVKNIPMYVIFF